jgi:hypothetical protein
MEKKTRKTLAGKMPMFKGSISPRWWAIKRIQIWGGVGWNPDLDFRRGEEV